MKLVVNGGEVEVDDRHAKTPLLWVLRDVLGLHGTKFGCGAGFCAACTVLIDGRNTKSCQTVTERAVGKAVTTVEGASGPVVDAVRDAWHRGNVVQCGYCQPGQTLAAVSLLESDASPDDPKINEWMSGNLCRCATYPRIRSAIHAAAGMLAAGENPESLVAALEPEVRRLTADELVDPVHPYIRIREDGTVVAFSSQIEMGQGIHTGLATIVAEELDADFDSVRVVNAANGAGPSGDVYGNPYAGGAFQITGASNSMKGFWVRYRLAAAQARARLVAAAGEAWDVPAAEVEIENGVVRHSSGKEAPIGELAARAEQLPVPHGVEPKDPGDYKLIGREGRLRVDAVAKILGATQFTIDVSLPGMLTAAVLHPLRFGATVASVDDGAALAEAGVTAVGADRGGRRGRCGDGRRRAARAACAGGGVGRHERRAAELRRAAGGARAAARIWRESRDVPERRRRRPGSVRGGRDGRCDVHLAVPCSRADGAEQRGVPNARGRRARRVGRDGDTRVREDERLRDRRDR